MELTVQNIFGLLLRSRLLPVDDAKTLFTRWNEDAKDAAANPDKFQRWMVARGYVTEYQASLLVRGHAEGFFLGDFKILDRLGKGRMAGVYKAQHKLGPVVAVKVLPPSKAKEPSLLGRFKREARLLLRLKHANIVRAFQVGDSEGLHYLVMEYLEGETLDEVMRRRGKFAPAEAVRLIHQALQGLHHIHQQGLVHRDLKPANLMLVGGSPDTTMRATVKILDIGLGRSLFDENVDEKSLEPGLTSEGVLLGTPDYMAPEQARDARAADIRADIYSLGCVLYHLLAGQLPFPDTNVISQMIRHATEQARPLKDFNSAVPDGLQQIINWMLAKDPAQRYPTPERAAQAMQVFLAAGTEPLAVPELDPKMRPFLQMLESQEKKENAAAGPPALPPGADGKAPAGKPPTSAAMPATGKAPDKSLDRQQRRHLLRQSIFGKVKAKLRAKMEAEIQRRLKKAGISPAAGKKNGGSKKKRKAEPPPTPPAPPPMPPTASAAKAPALNAPSVPIAAPVMPPAPPAPVASPPPAPPIMSAPVPEMSVDVELVSLQPQKPVRSGFSRRDMMFLGAGIAGGALAMLVGAFFAFRNK
jgi:serine/threonine protein kinase